MGYRKEVFSKQFSEVAKKFVRNYGDNIAVCSYGSTDKVSYAVFQFYYKYGEVHSVQCYPLKPVNVIAKILFTCGLAVDNAAKLIKAKEAKDA